MILGSHSAVSPVAGLEADRYLFLTKIAVRLTRCGCGLVAGCHLSPVSCHLGAEGQMTCLSQPDLGPQNLGPQLLLHSAVLIERLL